MDAIYHITTKRLWDHARESGEYRVGTLKTEGFVHASTAAQVADTAARFFAGQTDLILLTIDPRRLRAPLKWERAADAGELFPHVYGPINLDALLGVSAFEADADGRFPTPA